MQVFLLKLKIVIPPRIGGYVTFVFAFLAFVFALSLGGGKIPGLPCCKDLI